MTIAPARAAHCLLALTLTAAPLWSQATASAVDTWFDPSGASANGFGDQLAVEGDHLVITDRTSPDRWTVFAYRRTMDDWTPVQELQSSAPYAFWDGFGKATELDGDRLAVGAPYTEPAGGSQGTVSLYDFDGTSWTEVTVLTSPTPSFYGAFGHAVHLQGDLLVVGEPGAPVAGFDYCGVVHVYRLVAGTWILEQTLAPPQPAKGSEFGFDLDLEGSTLVVGAVGDPDPLVKTGAAFVFEHDGSGWSETHRLTGADAGFSDRFGWAVDLDGERIVVGAPEHDGVAENAGAVYGFEFEPTLGVWIGTDKLAPQTAKSGDRVGSSLELDGARLVVGAPFDPFGAVVGPDTDYAGTVLRWNLSPGGWVEAQRWVVPQDDPTFPKVDYLGAAVAFDGESVLAGAPVAVTPVDDDAGAVYRFEAPPLGLEPQPAQVEAGESVTFLVSGGDPGAAVALALAGVSGSPVPLAIFDVALFGPAGDHSVTVPSWPALAGLELQFLAGGFWQSGVLGLSPEVTVAIQ